MALRRGQQGAEVINTTPKMQASPLTSLPGEVRERHNASFLLPRALYGEARHQISGIRRAWLTSAKIPHKP
jgi:hypothetical protein